MSTGKLSLASMLRIALVMSSLVSLSFERRMVQFWARRLSMTEITRFLPPQPPRERVPPRLRRSSIDPSICWNSFKSTVVPGFSVLGFRALPWFKALNAGNQIWFYTIDLPGFSALPGFKAPFYGDGQSALNPGTTVSNKPITYRKRIRIGPLGLKFNHCCGR